MSNTLRQLLIMLAITAAGAGAYIYTHPLPCRQPITYDIGTFDSRFGLSRQEFLSDINAAAQLWNSAAGTQLFVYKDAGAEVPVNLIYDTRQQTTDRNQALDQSIDQNKTVASSVQQQYTGLKSQYDAQEAAYVSALDQYNQQLAAYNAGVEYWNSRGGAPQSEYQKLAEEKDALAQERTSVEAARLSLNSLGDQINALISKYNLLVDKINTSVDTINTSAGSEFDEGQYVSDRSGQRIDIFEFNSKQKLLRVLAHELGHALGLGHNQNPDSIMYPVNQGSAFALTKEDITAMKAECAITYQSLILSALKNPLGALQAH